MKNPKNLIILAISLFIVIIVLITTFFLLIKGEKLTDKNSVKVYFVKSFQVTDFRLTPVRRKLSIDKSRLTIAITELLKGPSKKEKKAGFYTEIPSTTKLIEIKETPKDITINLSKDFELGGGSTSMGMRLKQLVNTALDAEKDKPVYLELQEKRVESIGGEGVIVTQPLSR